MCDTCGETKLPLIDTNEYRRSVIEAFCLFPFHLLIPSDFES
jgi:hypothetical protein